MVNEALQNHYLLGIQKQLADSMPKQASDQLDFSRSVQTRVNGDTSYLRIGVKGKLVQNDFVLLQIDAYGKVRRGRRVSINELISGEAVKTKKYNGVITIHSLAGNLLITSQVDNGFVANL